MRGSFEALGALGLLAVAVGAIGCGNKAFQLSGGDAGAPVRDAVPDLVTVGVPVTGTFVAPGVSAMISFSTSAAFLRYDQYENPPYDFYLGTGDLSPGGQVTFDSPPGVVNAEFAASIQIGAALPHEFTSASGCGTITLTADFPPDAGANCDVPTDAGTCPPGCTRRLTLESGDSPCIVRTPGLVYETVTNAQCPQPGQATEGDWTLSLTEVDSHFVVDGVLSSPGLYLVHGTLTAQLVGSEEGAVDAGDGGLGTGTLQLKF
jgi:hypothetical protein